MGNRPVAAALPVGFSVIRPGRHRRQLALRCNLGLRRWWREITVYRDNNKSGGFVITERLYIDVKQDL